MTIDTAAHGNLGHHAPPPPGAIHELVHKVAVRPASHSPADGSIAHLLLRAACLHSESGLRIFGGDRDEAGTFRSYAELLDEAQCILGGLQKCGHFPGDNVVLLLERTIDLVPSLWACVLGGYVPCPLVQIRDDPEFWGKQVAHLDALLDGPLFVTRGASKLRGVDVADLETLRASAPEREIFAGRLRDPALIALTSGCSETSKAVVLTHENILASMAGNAERQKLTSADVALNWIPLDHVGALLEAHLLPLYVGATQLQVEREVILAQPLRFLRLIDRHRVTLAFAPDFILGQIKAVLQSAKPGPARRQILKCNLFSLRHLISGSEPNVIEGSRLFLDFLTQFGLARTAVWHAFCVPETCGGSVYSCEFPVRDPGRERATLGVPIDGLQMRIVDARGHALPAGEPGELQLHGPIIFARYYNDEAATAAAFTKDGWFRTRTVGRLEEGRLKLLGRSEDSVTVEGAQHFSHELETALEKLGAIERSFVAVFPVHHKGSDTEQLAVLFAPSFAMKDEGKLYQLTAAVRNTVTLLWGVRPSLILPLPKDLFPKTILGKIDRTALRNRLEHGELQAYEDRIAEVTNRHLGSHTPAHDAREVAIAAIYAELFGCVATSIGATTSFFDCGATSPDIVKLKRKLEQRLGLRGVSVATVLHNPTVREMAACVSPGRHTQRIEYEPIVPLQLSGNKTPLFCVHPENGDVLDYVNLAGYFVNERPFFALRARGFNEGEKCFGSFDELVGVYVSAIRKRKPHGPYAIAGYSYGGVVAFEIAKVLQALNERVAFVASFNQPPCFNCHEKRSKPASLEEGVVQSLQTIGRVYEASGTVGSMTVFYANPLQGSKEDWLIDDLKQWDGFTRLRNRYIDVAGEHNTFMGPKHVYSFQSVLRAELDRALGGM